ncbi:Uracil-DNA glycosylase [Halalkaliarchaeum sp. AArc-CO]|uniref:uracil-DNA glycosylase family protein n=1 Tax=unclassified Halalkaliarchaeum TaxID=2678344 RepID=UPI00217D5B39|nr:MULTISPECIES: uracil-DNA glycosylase family protein [unclassified Halalkaliarchaeum]MDR5671964.1 uracil-DNA glycosylase family protein [Halalkaliarchaeum sp. AArc-GB]UWG51470.1 Uracil-DNA glycosylase [Halalkaliarchaeum sp. AArc-CO]
MRNVTDRRRNPFGMTPPCDRYVPGYGDANADFHVVGDHPGVHGGIETGVPFTGAPWSASFLAALVDAGLLVDDDPERPRVASTFFSYLHSCVPDVEPPTPKSYADMERFFDAELRAIAAHVLLPVGERATEHVLETYTARDPERAREMDRLHASELHGSGFLVVPIKDPTDWSDDDADRLVEALVVLQATDYRRESDLGRFLPGGDPYYVR